MTNIVNRRRALWLNALVVGAVTGALALAAPTYADADTDREAKLVELRQTIEKTQEELKKIKADRASLEANLQQSETKIGELNKRVNELKAKLEDKQSHLNVLRSEKEALTSVKKQQQGSVEKHVNAAYRLGQQSRIKTLLSQQDPDAVSRNLKYYQYLTAAQAAKIQGYVESVEQINRLEPEINAALASESADHASLIDQREQLLSAQAQRKRTLEKLEATLSNKGDELQTLDRNRQNLEALVERMRAEQRAAPVAAFTPPAPKDAQPYPDEAPFAAMKGKLPWPTSGQVLRSFGSSRSTNKVHWQGMLIGADEGNPVYAVHRGRVVFSDYLRGHGLLLIIDHGDGFMSLYAHNQTLYKKSGDQVASGDQIAAVGLSGGQTHAGLYFEMRYKGEPTNPQPWLKKAA